MITIKTLLRQCGLVFLILCFPLIAVAQESGDELSKLRSGVAGLESDINKLQSSLLFPPLTRMDVYLSVDKKSEFQIQTMKILLDNDQKAMHIYGKDEQGAFASGGTHQVWQGNVGLGKHQLKAVIVGENASGKLITGKANLTFNKTTEGKSVEVIVRPSKDGKSVDFTVKDWGETQ